MRKMWDQAAASKHRQHCGNALPMGQEKRRDYRVAQGFEMSRRKIKLAQSRLHDGNSQLPRSAWTTTQQGAYSMKMKAKTKTFASLSRSVLLGLCLGLSLAFVANAGWAQSTSDATPEIKEAPAATKAAAQAYESDYNVFQSVVAEHGMVVSEQMLASQVGRAILEAGGNAVDAAVAVGFALAVTLPYSGNIGGGGFMMFHNADSGENFALDFREKAPHAATRDMYLDDEGQVIGDKSLHTHQAVGVPGTVAGLTHALQHWGTMPLVQVMAPAIKLAEGGFPVSQRLAKVLAREKD